MKRTVMNPVIKYMMTLFMAAGTFTTAAAQQETSTAVAAAADAGWPMSVLSWLMVIVSLILLVVIIMLSGMVKNAFLKKLEDKTNGTLPMLILAMAAIFMLPLEGYAQDAAETVMQTPKTSDLINSNTISWILLLTIAVEFFVIMWLLTVLKRLLGIERQKVSQPVAEQEVKPARVSWWDKFNRSASLEQEKDVQLDHNYDGIRELDNKLPPWWVYGFYATIIFSFIYIWRYHVSKSAPLQLEELKIEIANAEAEMKKRAVAGLDENTVTLMTEAGDIASGKAVFAKNCVACHGLEGQGAAVGPNLVDDYWLHGGDVKDIFKTIKYGVQGKGMKAWQNDLRPIEIAQLVAYIKSQRGKSLPDPKAPQGELYGATVATDSTAGTPGVASSDTLQKDSTTKSK